MRKLYTFTAKFPHGEIKQRFVKVDAEPDGSTVKMTFDVAEEDDLWPVLSKLYLFGHDLFESFSLEKLAGVKEHSGTGVLKQFDGKGVEAKVWNLTELWPRSVNFGELCYSSSSDLDVEVVWHYR
jgi:hypothetical protein